MAAIAGSMLGGLAATHTITMPFFLDIAVCLVGAAVASTLVEPQHSQKFAKTESSRHQIRSIIVYIRQHDRIKWLVVMYAVMTAMALMMTWFSQSFLAQLHVSGVVTGLWRALVNITGAGFAWWSPMREERV